MTKELLCKIKEIEEKVGKNWLEIILKADSEAHLLKIAKEYGVNLTRDQASEGYKLLKSEAKILSETDLAEVSGGVPIPPK
ncbi:MAG TPA: hypothetical protein PLD70_11370 [Thermotogota bacterium]|nr:hypothetical protein [Thermotogota bacterium]